MTLLTMVYIQTTASVFHLKSAHFIWMSDQYTVNL